MLLNNIIRQIETLSIHGNTDTSISNITHDSRSAGPNDIFVAIRGEKIDGRRFTPTLQVAAVIADASVDVLEGVTTIIVPDARKALAYAAAALYNHPSKEMFVVGLTGTNGKSTTASLLEHIFHDNQIPVGVLGTIGHRLFGQNISIQDGRTTPEASTMQKLLRSWKDQGCEVVVMEASSIGLAWNRVDGIRFSAACFTNFSRDHLDFHGSMEEYLTAKRRLFLELVDRDSTCILNFEDPACAETHTKGTKWLFSPKNPTDLYATDVIPSLSGTQCTVHSPKGSCSVETPLIGEHNIDNMLCAIGVALSYGLSLPQIASSLRTLPAVPGRLERVPASIPIFVDYAHSPDALAHVLKTLRPLCEGKLITVFGCGGDRDKGKRPIMGKIAEQYSDICVVTSDNPRTESPQSIINEIAFGMSHSHQHFISREQGIAFAIAQAKPKDVVIIAGKGHETYQEIKGIKNPFDDRIIASKYANQGDNHAV